MNGQMTIFDFLAPAYPDINDITEEEAARIIGDAIGAQFKYVDRFREWQGKIGKLKLSVGYSHFILDDNHDLFVDTDYQFGTEGGGAPCTSIEGVVKWFRKKIKQYS